jgi:hypothetical protein
MKTHYAILLLLLVPLSLFAQEIELDRVDANGCRHIVASAKRYEIDWTRYEFRLKAYYAKDDEIHWEMLISSVDVIPETAAVLLRLGNGEVMLLPNDTVHLCDANSSDMWLYPTFGGFEGRVVKSQYYVSTYALSVEQLDKIIQQGITKLRITGGVSYRDRDWFYNELGKYLTRSKKLIDRQLRTINSIYKDF